MSTQAGPTSSSQPWGWWQIHSIPSRRQSRGGRWRRCRRSCTPCSIPLPCVKPRASSWNSWTQRTVRSSSQHPSSMTGLFAVAKTWPSDAPGTLRVTEIVTDLSPLGSHAKVFVADREHGYVGSANITGAGLGRHVEIGVELSGPQIEKFVRVLVALEHAGTLVLVAGPNR